jgi:replication factor A1
MDLDNEAEALASDLGQDKEEVKQALQNLVEYSVPLDEAKQSVRRKYGDGDGGDATPSTRDVADIETGDGNVSVTVVVLTVGKRSIRYQGDDLVIYEGELADETGKISYTAWEDSPWEDLGVEPGDALEIGNAGVREWEGQPELNLGGSTQVRTVEAFDVPYEVGGDRDLLELAPGDRGVDVEVSVLEAERRTIDGRDGPTEIIDGVVADDTARLPTTDWDPHEEIREGESVRIENAFVREYRGVPSLNVSEFSTVTALERAVEVGDAAPRMAIGEAVASGGVYDVEVVGNVLEVRDGSGLIQRCPECSRVIQNGQCRTHGEVEGEDDMRVKAILDDGTGTLTAVLDRELTEEVYGGTLEDALDQARDAMDRDVVGESISEKLVGREFRVRGHLSVDEYGANVDASEFDETGEDPADSARALLEEVGE